jgi:hypothetical protein
MIEARLTLGGVEYTMFFHCPHCTSMPFVFITSSYSTATEMDERLRHRHVLCAGDEIDIVTGEVV